jgi:hypothetical protein
MCVSGKGCWVCSVVAAELVLGWSSSVEKLVWGEWLCGLAVGGEGGVGIGMLGCGGEGSVVIGGMVIFFVGVVGGCWFVSWSIGNGLGNEG